MSIVCFATTCDRCGARSEEYTSWPLCRSCGADTCPSCAVPGSLVTGDGEGPDKVSCLECADDEQLITKLAALRLMRDMGGITSAQHREMLDELADVVERP